MTLLSERDAASLIRNTASRAVVLLHGLGSASEEALALQIALRKRGFHVAVPSLEGLHDRTRPWFWRWISDSLLEIDRQAVAHREINLCGINYGAALALAVAAERSIKLDSLVLISPSLDFSSSTFSRFRSQVLSSEWLPDWFASVCHLPRPASVKQEGASDAFGYSRVGRTPSTARSAISSAQLREARQLIRHVDGSLGRVRTPTLIICPSDDAAMVADVRYVQVHIGSQFAELILEPIHRLITHNHPSEIMVLKVVEFFNEVGRRRALATLSRS